jgi:hypothetical protein
MISVDTLYMQKRTRSTKSPGSRRSIRSTRSKSKSPSSPQTKIQKLDLPDLTSTLADELRLTFKDLTIEVDRNKYDDIYKRTYDYIHGLMCDDKTRCECFALRVYPEPDEFVHVDRIKYKYGSECSLTGTDVLVRLTKLFREQHIPRVQIYDSARIHIMVDGKPHELKLSTYHILLHGESWYNKYGYRGDRYETESEKNNKLRGSNLSPKLLKSVNNALEGVFVFPKNTTFSEFVKKVDEQRRDMLVEPEIQNLFMRAYLLVEEYLNNNRKVAYDYSDLKLRRTLDANQ